MSFNPAKYLPSAAYKKAGIIIANATLVGTAPATGTNYGTFFIAPYKCVVLGVDVMHGTASSSGTVNVEKLVDGDAQDAGDDLLSSVVSTAGTADTVTAGTLTTTTATLELAEGERLGLVDGGTLTSCANLTITVTLAPIP